MIKLVITGDELKYKIQKADELVYLNQAKMYETGFFHSDSEFMSVNNIIVYHQVFKNGKIILQYNSVTKVGFEIKIPDKGESFHYYTSFLLLKETISYIMMDKHMIGCYAGVYSDDTDYIHDGAIILPSGWSKYTKDEISQVINTLEQKNKG